MSGHRQQVLGEPDRCRLIAHRTGTDCTPARVLAGGVLAGDSATADGLGQKHCRSSDLRLRQRPGTA